MPIINFSFDHDKSEYPMGAFSPLSNHLYNGQKIILWSTFECCCIKERERNTYHDSDFYMTVWDEESQSAKEIMFATTRGWTYPALASKVDATPEVLEKYAEWQRKERIRNRWAQRQRDIERSRKIGVDSYLKYRRLAQCYDFDTLYEIEKLLKTKKFRSSFRESLYDQIHAWLNTPRKNRKYSSPLSPKQLSYL